MTREPMQEKLIELLGGFSTPVTINGEKLTDWYIPMKQLREKLADHLIANGVRLEEKQATSNRENLDVHSRLMGLLQRAPYIGCADTDRQYAVNWLMNNGVTIQKRGWIKVYHGAMYPYSCSECGNCHARRVNFCEHCGTKLDLPEPPKGE